MKLLCTLLFVFLAAGFERDFQRAIDDSVKREQLDE